VQQIHQSPRRRGAVRVAQVRLGLVDRAEDGGGGGAWSTIRNARRRRPVRRGAGRLGADLLEAAELLGQQLQAGAGHELPPAVARLHQPPRREGFPTLSTVAVNGRFGRAIWPF